MGERLFQRSFSKAAFTQYVLDESESKMNEKMNRQYGKAWFIIRIKFILYTQRIH